MNSVLYSKFPFVVTFTFIITSGLFIETTAAGESSYSPYADQNYPTRILWGDTHLHTANSLDARALGVTLTVEDAYRFARGD